MYESECDALVSGGEVRMECCGKRLLLGVCYIIITFVSLVCLVVARNGYSYVTLKDTS